MKLANPTFKISIPEPCSQNWEEMAFSKNGRHCQYCQKEVVDFTAMSSSEIQDWFSKSAGNVCGKLYPSAFTTHGHSLDQHKNLLSTPIKFLIAACLTVATNVKSNASSAFKSSYSMELSIDSYGEKAEKDAVPFLSDSLVRIRGVVRDAEDGSPLPGAQIKVKNSNLFVNTNAEGKFTIDVPAENKNVALIISCIGYNTKESEISLNQKDVEVLITANQAIMGAVVIVEKRYQNFFLNTGMIWYRKISRLFH